MQQILLSLITPIQMFLAKNQKNIKYGIGVFWFLLLSFFLISTQEIFMPYWRELGKKAGTFSLIAFLTTLIPGIMKRFGLTTGFLLPIRTSTMLFRKEIGITMYLLALTHLFWSRILPILSFGGDLTSFQPFELFGMIAFMLATPMFLTSNSWTYKNYKKIWKTIHSVTYVIVWILFFHVALRELDIKGIAVIGMAVIEWGSLIYANFLKPQSQIVPEKSEPLQNEPLNR